MFPTVDSFSILPNFALFSGQFVLVCLGEVGSGHGEDAAHLPAAEPLPANRADQLQAALVSALQTFLPWFLY